MIVLTEETPAQGEGCRTFTHGGFAKDRGATVVECTIHPQWVRTIRGDAKHRGEQAIAAAVEHVRSHS